ncbi:MAG: glycosyltransferase [Chromatiaceae bacterium]|nr:glycosyltransferase [Chromatiaceae bacterium]MCF7994287.1 glycosyltransferase [Chromatiaceae bacterium]MCF8003278.1 glycosyltransferase [Chromatiaceae bacterium]
MSAPTLLLLTRYGELGSSSRLRLMAYRPWLEQAGFRVTVSALFQDDELRARYANGRSSARSILRVYQRRLRALMELGQIQLVWVEKELFPFLPGVLERWLTWAGVPYVVDYDDATFHRYDAHRSVLVRRLLGRRLVPLMRGAHLVTAGNAYLADYAQRAGAPDVSLVPTVLDVDQYALAAEPDAALLRVGWIGSPSTASYLRLVREPLQRLARERPVQLVVIGAEAIPSMDVPVEHHPWSASTESALLGSVHLGIMPLTDGPWEQGKCGYKLLQYLACGKPVITSPVGVNVEIATPAVGLLASNPDQWLAALRRLGADVLLRRRLGRAGRRRVEAQYSLQLQGPIVAARLAEAAGITPAPWSSPPAEMHL